jgi:uncharacterized protein
MSNLKSLIIFALAAYCGIVGLMYVAQRALMYFPDTARTVPADAGFAAAEEVTLHSADGTKVLAWYVAPRGDKPLVVYFHGNGGALRHRVARFAPMVADGTGLLALSYRGYGGSDGSPSETGMIADAMAAYDFATARCPASPMVLWGESLGTGVAVAIAAQKAVAALVLEAPFTSTSALAFATYPFLPVRWLMKDQFRSDERIHAVKAPILIMHGRRDRVVPIAYGERLFALAPEPKRMVRFADGGHEDLDRHGALKTAQEFLAKTLPQAGKHSG